MATFNDLLNRASKIVPSSDSQSPTKQIRLEQHDLRSIFRASDEIWKRKQLRSDSQWKPRDAITGALAKTSNNSEFLTQQVEPTGPLDHSTSVTFDDYVNQSVERAKIEAERAFINQHILEEQSYWSARKNEDRLREMNSTLEANKTNTSLFAEVQPDELVINKFAHYVSQSISNKCSSSIESAVRDTLKDIDEADSNKLWRKVFALFKCTRASDSINISDFRNSDQWKYFVIEESTHLLQQIFKEHMQSVIDKNLQLAQRGGIPGTASLIDAYLNVCLDTTFKYQDKKYGNHPIWPVLFLCLRIGDYAMASKVAVELQNASDASILVKILCEFGSDYLVDGDKRFQLNAEWKHVMSNCVDPYKRAVYAAILGHECPEVNSSIENWLWSRLMNCKLDPVNGIGHFYKLQSTICIDYGEQYFVEGSGNFMVYFTVLWLTGQLERAIDLLFRNQPHHAVHVAILAYQKKFINISPRAKADILTIDPKDPIQCQLNFSRIVLLYVKNFEMTNLDYTISYCFFLRNIDFECDGGLNGGNIFEACVSRMCFISQKVDVILGQMSKTGDRVPGLIDKFASEIDVYQIIARVASDFDSCGDSLTACRLYILSGHPNEALKICSKQLATYLTIAHEKNDPKVLDETVTLATWLVKRYQQRPEEHVFNDTYLGELSMLINLSEFYIAANSNSMEALTIIKKLNLLPLTTEELSSRVSHFVNLPEYVRFVMPDVVLLLMEVLFKLYGEAVPVAKRASYRSCSNVLLLYVAQINLRFPVNVNTKILKLQSQMH